MLLFLKLTRNNGFLCYNNSVSGKEYIVFKEKVNLFKWEQKKAGKSKTSSYKRIIKTALALISDL